MLFSTTQIISQSEQTITFQQFVQDVDESILTADQERGFVTLQISIPANVSLEVENNQLIFKVFLDTWHLVTRTYRCPIQISGQLSQGIHQLSVHATEELILITFQQI